MKMPPRTFQDLVLALQRYWAEQGCVLLQPYDMEVGAGTFHTATFLRAIGPEPWNAAYVQPSRRPTDGRYGDNPFRLQHYYQFQVVMKPSPTDIIDRYLGSLAALGIDPLTHDIRLVEDNWESPTLGAWGLGWEIWLNGMEVTQFTYFQQAGGLDCRPVMGEITYGLERLAMYMQGVESVYDLLWTDGAAGRVTYGDVYHQNEVEQSAFNFEQADAPSLFAEFEQREKNCRALLDAALPLPAYEQTLKASHVFNLLDARKAISVTERQRYILRVRALARAVASAYYASREAQGFPMLRQALMNRHDFLVEIGAEELPPKSLVAMGESFRDSVVTGLDGAGLSHGDALAYFTPRRLAVLVSKVLDRQPEQRVERRGPPVSAAFDAAGKPTRAATAFAESCGVKVGDLTRLDDTKGQFLFCRTTRAGEQASKLLPGIVQAALDALPIARRMRWGAGTVQFVRPVHWVVMLHGDQVVPGEILGLRAGRMTRGHRFHARKPIALRSPGGYLAALAKGHVIADFEARRERIRAGALAAAEAEGGVAAIDPAVLDEVTSLTEWPVPMAGHFEPRFLDLPSEVLVATLQDHQRYFPVRSKDGKLLPRFIAVANIDSKDPPQVRAGNERVVRPRLADAAFFYAADRKSTLASRREALASVTFQAQLGSLADKGARITALAAQIARIAGQDSEAAQRAAELAKCDLVTAMVGEFPELQGTMGRYYALNDGEPEGVAEAIAEQYMPRFAGDALPATGAGLALAVADKLDTLVGIFAIGQKPTGTKDPYGLRRSALGVLRILIETGIGLDLRELIRSALDSVRADLARLQGKQPADGLVDEIYDYMMERLRTWYLEGGNAITTEMFDAVLDTRPVSPLDFDDRLRALANFLKLPDAASLTAANKRIANILRKAGEQPSPRVDPGLLADPNERRLATEVETLRQDVERLVTARRYAEALTRLASLRPAVDAFFDHVLVMAEDVRVRANRLALLGALQRLFLHMANLSRLPG